MRIKSISMIILTTLLIFALAFSVQAKTTIKVTYWGGQSKVNDFKELKARFEEQYPDIEVELINIAQQYVQKVLTMIAGGDIPDVMNTNPPLFAQLGDQFLLDHTEYMKQSKYAYLEDGFEEFLNMVSDGYYEPGDPLLGAPLGIGTHTLVYNKRLFDEAGLAYPDASWTWQGDFLTAAQKLTKEGQFGVTGLRYGPGLGGILKTFVWAWGGEVYGKDTDDYLLDSPAALEGLQFAQDLVYKYNVSPSPAQEESLLGGGLATGKVAMEILPSFKIPALTNQMTDPWALAPMPKGPDSRATTFYGGALSVVKLSKNQDAAWKYVEFMTGTPGIEVLCNASGFNAPTLKSAAFSDDFINYPGAPENHIVRLEAIRDYAKIFNIIHPNANEVNQAWEEIVSQFWSGKITAEELVSQGKEKVAPLLEK